MASGTLAASRGSAMCLFQEARQYCTATSCHTKVLGGTQRRPSRPIPWAMPETVTARAESRRQYGFRRKQQKPVPSKAFSPRTQPSSAPKSQGTSSENLGISVNDVPGTEFWDEARTDLIQNRGVAPDAVPLNSAACVFLTKLYLEANLDDNGRPLVWATPSTMKKLISLNIPPAHLHYVAVQILASGQRTRLPQGLMKLALRMLDHASALGHQPSTLTLCLTALKQISIHEGRQISDLRQPFVGAIGRVRAQFRSGAGAAVQDPDSLAVWGLIHFVDGSLKTAERFLRRALGPSLPPPATSKHAAEPDVDLTPRPPRFDAEPAALMALANITARLGRPGVDEAAYLAVGAFQLDLAPACLHLGLMADTLETKGQGGGGGGDGKGGGSSARSSKYLPYREELLTKAAMAGLTPAYHALAAIERFKAGAAVKGISDVSGHGVGTVVSASHHLMTAAEWDRIARAAEETDRIKKESFEKNADTKKQEA
ncbi:hypothetical protein MAPG_06331 [Magnaporthiopsis poae ATCC 64411]|uniref:Uncharacterized protein n=1 Tax=Magnaporthiopsis poae (strain ATCC 64411 / 73-15) TaxID=644358 RepID=A0A0C4E1R1_MAGP6|nr:hypothetical protein MAPG_06331 [Magnaporthiopsis poae ATCC 64411]